MITNPAKLARIFNEFFINKVKKLRAKSRMTPNSDPVLRVRKWLDKRTSPPPIFKIKKIDTEALRKAMKRMKGKKVHGVDNIDSYSIKIAGPLMEEALLQLVNKSIEQMKFAKNWKPQLVKPLHKKKEKTLVGNFRPVSNLVEVGKVVEYAVAEQIITHFIENNLFHPNHHGGLPNHSTATALIQMVDMWIEAAENSELSGVCMIDQSAAYDLLDHFLFPKKLKEYNFDEASIEWIRSYLGDRKQCVKIESKTSELLDCEESGAPQGSVLAGVFHIINSNDMPDCHEEAESVIFVDDDTDSVRAKKPEELVEKLQREVDNSVNWLKDNRLCVAGDKSKILIVSTKQLRRARLRNKLAIVVDQDIIEETTSEKLLGVVVNNTLTWKEHLYGDNENEGLITQLKKRVGTLKRLAKYMNKSRLSMLSEGIFY